MANIDALVANQIADILKLSLAKAQPELPRTSKMGSFVATKYIYWHCGNLSYTSMILYI